MLPQQTEYVNEARAALAPYNFVPLPNKVVPAEPLPPHDVYNKDLLTGRIECTLTTASPLYVRCGLNLEQFQQGLEAKDQADFFYLYDKQQPVIPGSSLRGLLRALVEIAGYGKLERVSDQPRFFYRAVAAQRDDPLAAPYRGQLRSVKAGVLERHGDEWRIRPARLINGESFIKVREQDVPATLGLIRLNNSNYQLQVIEVSFTTKRLKPSPRSPQGRTVIDLINKPGVHSEAGWLVTSGNMTETGQPGQRSPRKNHVVVPQPGEGEWRIAATAVADYLRGLSEYQREQLGEQGVLKHERPVFYCEPARGASEVIYFGHSPNFRLPFRFPGSARAATPLDFVPAALRSETIVDLAEAIFGTVRRQKQQGKATQAIAGRVFVGDAQLVAGQDDPFLGPEAVTPQVLGGPKPTTFQHYLTQPSDTQATLKHYASAPDTETVVRGHKLYWHKGDSPDFVLAAEQRQKTNDTQLTSIRPVKPGVRFSFDIQFENLRPAELGALLWVLATAADERYRLKLGMGKPLGLGSVQLNSKLFVGNRQTRYSTLFNGDNWADGEPADPVSADEQHYLDAFHTYVLTHSGEPQQYQRIDETLRIRCLLALLSWHGPNPAETRYLEIERDPRKGFVRAADTRGGKANEYKNRPVLPSPRQIIGEVTAPPVNEPPARLVPRPAPEPLPKPEPVRPAAPELPAVGTTFTGLVIERDDELVVIAVPGFDKQQAVALLKVEADTPKWTVGKDRARVEVVGQRARGELTILSVKRAGPTPKK